MTSSFFQPWQVFKHLHTPLRLIVAAVTLTALAAIAEGAGLGMLLPLLNFVEQGDALFSSTSQSPVVRMMVSVFSALSLKPSFGALVVLSMLPFVLRQVVLFLRISVIGSIQHNAAANLRVRAVSAGLHADLPFFIDQKHGDCLNMIGSEPHNAGMVVNIVISLLLNLVLSIAYLTLMMIVSWQLTVMSLPLVLGLFLIVRRFSGKARRFSSGVVESTNIFYRELSEAIRGIRAIKMRACEPTVITRLQGSVQRIAEGLHNYEKSRAVVEAGGPLILTMGTFSLLYWAVAELHMSLASLGFYLFIILRLQQTLTQVNGDRMGYARQTVALEKVLDIITRAEESHQIVSGMRHFSMEDRIEFDHVSFAYASDRRQTPVLKGLDLCLRQGETVALVGRSGAGKSTAIDLICRHYRPDGGRILVDGHDLADFDIASLRRGIGLVSQETFLFHDSVRYNLVYGLDPVPDQATIEEALEISQAKSFVDALPDGLDTVLGEEAADLSGGQRQRLSLARALVQRPHLLILDEPTSALDAETEAAVQRSLNHLHGRMSILIIAHRLATIQAADRIYLLDQGRVAAQGTHESLVTQDSGYRRLFQMQEIS